MWIWYLLENSYFLYICGSLLLVIFNNNPYFSTLIVGRMRLSHLWKVVFKVSVCKYIYTMKYLFSHQVVSDSSATPWTVVHQALLWILYHWAIPVKNPPAKQETQVRSLGWDGALEKRMATHSSILAWEVPWTGEPGRLQSMGSQRVGQNWACE